MGDFPSRAEIAAMRNGMAKPLTDAPPPVDPTLCPHCGRKLGRGRAIHIKHCKGK